MTGPLPSFVPVYTARDEVELLVLRSLLESQGIGTAVVSDSVNRLFGLSTLPLGFDEGPDPLAIFVHETDAERAALILDERESSSGASAERIQGNRLLVILDRDHRVALRKDADGQLRLPEGELPEALIDRLTFVAPWEDEGDGYDFFSAQERADELPDSGLFWVTLDRALAQGWGPSLRKAYVGALLNAQDPAPELAHFGAFAFGATRRHADELGRLVRSGKKTGTAGLLWSYEAEESTLPSAGSVWIIPDGRGHPLCAIRTITVNTLPYDQVDAEHAAAEGEGDLSLDYWRSVHWKFFSAECAQIAREPSLDMPVVLERFELVAVY